MHHLLGHVVGDFKPYRIPKLTLRQLATQGFSQVGYFFVIDEEVAVTRDAKLVDACHCHTREKLTDTVIQDRAKHHETK